MADQLKLMGRVYARARRKKYPVHEHFWVSMTLAFIGGFLESYTYLLKGNVFANAQTGNFALMAMNFTYFHNPLKALFYLIPISAYVLGIFMTIHMPSHIKGKVSWYTVFVIIQFCVFFMVGLLPASVPNSVTTVAVAFLCAMQYNTFKACRGVVMSTVFCTNNLRQLALAVSKNLNSDRNALFRSGILYLVNIIFFVSGAAVGGYLIYLLARLGWHSERAIWLCCVILVPLGLYLHIKGDRETAKLRKMQAQLAEQ